MAYNPEKQKEKEERERLADEAYERANARRNAAIDRHEKYYAHVAHALAKLGISRIDLAEYLKGPQEADR